MCSLLLAFLGWQHCRMTAEQSGLAVVLCCLERSRAVWPGKLHVHRCFHHSLNPLFALTLVTAWIYDRNPFQPMRWQDDLEKFKGRLERGEDVFGACVAG